MEELINVLNGTMGSPECQTFKLHYQELKLGLDPASVVDSAFAKGLLTREERDAAAHPLYTDYEKLDKFLSAVDKRIAVKPDAFHTFMEVLDGEPAFDDLAEKLKGKSLCQRALRICSKPVYRCSS